MNKQELIALIKDTTGPQVAALVEEQISKTIEKQNAQPPTWAAALFGKASDTVKAVRDKGLGFGRIVNAMANAKRDGSGIEGAQRVLKAWGDEDLAKGIEDSRQKALGLSQGAAGGYLVPIQQAAEIIELRRAATVIRSSGVREIPLPTGTMQMPKIATGATGSYIGENQNITKSEQTFGNVTLTAKKLAVITPLSMDLARNSSPQADAIVRDDIVQSLAVTEDAAFLRADGTNGQPKGLRYQVNATNLVAAQATSLANVASDLGSALLCLMNANIAAGGWRWIIAPRTWKYLFTVQNSNGFYAFQDEMKTGTLWGFPFSMTTSVPITLTSGSNTDASEVYLFNPSDVMVGDNLNLSIDVSTEAAYFDGSSVVAAFSRDQMVVRAIAEHDLGVRQDKAIAVITGVRWGV